MRIRDFETECGTGLCCTAELNGEEFILSHCFDDGVYGVKNTVDRILREIEDVPTIHFRYITIQHTLALELKSGLVDERLHNCLERDYDIPMSLPTDAKDLALSLCLSLAKLTLEDVEG